VNRRILRLARGAFLLALLGLATACATGTPRVQPWDRDLLSEQKMRFIPCPMLYALDEHVYFSKEGSTGGQDAAGGGCGCN
jgi:hypothetical protein